MTKLAVRQREAAQMLSISLSHLEKLTAAGKIPHAKVGRSVLYDVEDLRAWLQSMKQTKGNGNEQ